MDCKIIGSENIVIKAESITEAFALLYLAKKNEPCNHCGCSDVPILFDTSIIPKNLQEGVKQCKRTLNP